MKLSKNIGEIIELEIGYNNFKVELPRTRAFLSHKRTSAQGVRV